MTSVRDKLFEQMQASRDAKAQQAMELLGQVAKAELDEGKQPRVGDLVTLLCDLGITEEDVDRYVNLLLGIREAQGVLDSTSDQTAKWSEIKQREAELKAEADAFQKRHGDAMKEIHRQKRVLFNLDSDRVHAEQNLARLQRELTAMERRFRNLPPEIKEPYHSPRPVVNPDVRAMRMMEERQQRRDAVTPEASASD